MDKFLQSERTCVEDIFYPPPSKNSNGTLQNKERVSRIYSTFFFFLQEAEKLWAVNMGLHFVSNCSFPLLHVKGQLMVTPRGSRATQDKKKTKMMRRKES